MKGLINNTDCLGYSVFTGKLEDISLTDKKLVNTINQYSYCMAEMDPDFKLSLLESDILLPDGVGIVLASKILNGKVINKIAGADLHHFLLNKLNRTGGSCFYLGSSEETLRKIEARISKEYPNISFGSFSPPYKTVFSETENKEMLTAVNSFKPDVLFVGMTAPKQEKWAHSNKTSLDTKIICSIGAVFDFYAGTVERPDKFWIGLGLEWFGRLLNEPKRMWRRYLYFGPVFGYYILKGKFRKFTGQRL